jgi:Ala-tRNA(Pro) deacylase
MSIAMRVEAYLAENDVEYETIDHPPAFTAQAEAAAAHVSGRSWAKTVQVLLDGAPALVVVPATRHLDLEKLGRVAGAEQAKLASEAELESFFPDCDLGAMPPFGNLYGQPTFVDETMREQERITFHAGDHRSALEMAYRDWERLAEPIPGDLAGAPRESA